MESFCLEPVCHCIPVGGGRNTVAEAAASFLLMNPGEK